MKDYTVTLRGENPLLLHNDDVRWADAMREWTKDPANRDGSVAGDDRSPAFRWLGCLYQHDGVVAMPQENLMTMLRDGGKRCPTGKRQGTFKAQTQSGLLLMAPAWPLLIDGKPVSMAALDKLRTETNFLKHEQVVAALGFELHVKRAKVDKKKHVRVRPMFRRWSLTGVVRVVDDMITEDVLGKILSFAGRYAGLGDWRPGSPMSPGSYGVFTVEVKEV